MRLIGKAIGKLVEAIGIPGILIIIAAVTATIFLIRFFRYSQEKRLDRAANKLAQEYLGDKGDKEK